MLSLHKKKHGIHFYTVWFATEPFQKPGIVAYYEYAGDKPKTECSEFETLITDLSEAEEEIKSFVLRYDGIHYAYQLMEKYRQKAIEALKIFPENVYKSSLIALLNYAINRMH